MTGGNSQRRRRRRMDVKKTLMFTILLLMLTACGSGDAGDDPVSSDSPAPTLPPANPDLPPGGQNPGDKLPTRFDKLPENAGEVFISSSDLLVMESYPIQVTLTVEGTTPTPCHGLGWVENDDGTTIAVTVFSIEPGPAVTCIAVEEPFALSIPLGSFADEARSVVLNGQAIGEFTS